ncbi:unnamed protein product [Meloidogyne enterolobii]|uniref:Uncharacterized protein n=1 Tax=Meloidogyne enterolobii TaxID=390850 RepID=A0ACB0XLI3_MELEN
MDILSILLIFCVLKEQQSLFSFTLYLFFAYLYLYIFFYFLFLYAHSLYSLVVVCWLFAK